MKYEIKQTITNLIIGTVAVICLLLLFTDLKNPKFTLKEFINGSYQTKLENVVRENFPNYKRHENIKSSFNTIIGLKDTDQIYNGKDNYLLEKYNAPTNTEQKIKELNNLFNKLIYININLILVPSSITINKEKLPAFAPTHNELKTIEEVYKQTKINKHDVYQILLENNKKYQMYYHTDNNITPYAAYYIYNKFAFENNIIPNDITAYDIDLTSQTFYGDLINKTKNFSYQPDQVFAFTLNGIDIKNETVNNVQIITNNSSNVTKEIIVIKDKYGDAFISFLKDHYKKIHIIDVNTKINLVEYISSNSNVNDMVIILNINKFDNYKF